MAAANKQSVHRSPEFGPNKSLTMNSGNNMKIATKKNEMPPVYNRLFLKALLHLILAIHYVALGNMTIAIALLQII